MRKLKLFAAAVAATAAVPADAAFVQYGVAFDRTDYSFDSIRGDQSGLRNPGAIFTFDTDTDALLSFNIDLGYPVNNITPAVQGLLTSAGACDLACFIGSINAGNWSTSSGRTGNTSTFLTFGGPLNGTVQISAPFAAGNVTIGGPMRVTGPVPEPATWALLLLGFGMIGSGIRKSRRARAIPVCA